MNVFNSCDSTDIFILLKIKCSIQPGFASLNRTFHLSPLEISVISLPLTFITFIIIIQ